MHVIVVVTLIVVVLVRSFMVLTVAFKSHLHICCAAGTD